MKHLILICALLAMLFAACTDSGSQSSTQSSAVKGENSFEISGTLPAAAGTRVALKQFRINKKGKVKSYVMDTARLDGSGTFEMSGLLREPMWGELTFTGDAMPAIVLPLRGEPLHLEASDSTIASLKIEGPAGADELPSLVAFARATQRQTRIIENQRQASEDQEVRDSLVRTKLDILSTYSARMRDGLKSEEPLVAFYASEVVNWRKYFEDVKVFAARIKEDPVFGNSVYMQNLQSKIAKYEKTLASQRANTMLGETAPDIKLEGPDGRTYQLSALRGKVVLVDFWASWCKPCRRENPNLVANYNQFRRDGFEIFSVSLDEDREKWIKAIADDGLSWKQHGSDLQGFASGASTAYKVNAIPAGFLVDRNGIIRAERAALRGPGLEQEIQQLLGE